MALIANFQRRAFRSRLPEADAGLPAQPPAHPYDEAAFRYFLAVDRRRAERGRRSLLLVLVTIQLSPGRAAALSATTGGLLFGGLRGCIREVDLVGWLRQRHVAAALLVQGVAVPADVPHLIAERIRSVLREQLSAEQAGALRVRVIPLGGSSKSEVQ